MIFTVDPEGLSWKTSKLHRCSTCVNVIRNIPSKKHFIPQSFIKQENVFLPETAGLWKLTVPIETPFTSVLDILCQKANTQRPSYRINVPPCQEIGPSSPHFLSLSVSFFLSTSEQSEHGGVDCSFCLFCSSNWPPSGKLMTRAFLERLQSSAALQPVWWARAQWMM